MMMHNLRVTAGQQTEGSLGANNIHRLPEAVKHEHRLIKRGFHTDNANNVQPSTDCQGEA